MSQLLTLPVLMMDCQATGASPSKGDLLDIAWVEATASDDDTTIHAAMTATLVQLSTHHQRVPNRITQLTGIRTAMLADAPTHDDVSQQLAEVFDAHDTIYPLAHYARFERPFVEQLLDRQVNFICTHDIAKRLLPGLPRRGLRPLAGYFGKIPEEVKRASDHVMATALIWRELVSLLVHEEGVETYDELMTWLATKKVDRNVARQLPLPREVRLALPEVPGVYRMRSKQGAVLYVGKATSLKQRVNSYFRGRKGIAEKTLELITQVWSLETTEVGSPFEAALLETDEIKRLDPPYNQQLKHHDRQIWFAHPNDPLDLQNIYDDTHTLGPFGSTLPIERAGALLRTIWGELTPMPGEVFFDIGAEDEVFTQGLALFVKDHQITPQYTAQDLLYLGQTRWLERLELMLALAQEVSQDNVEETHAATDLDDMSDDTLAALDEDFDDDLGDMLDEELFEWTPEHVCGACINIAMGYYKAIERAHAVTLFLDVTIDWLPTHEPLVSPRTLIFRQGKLDSSIEPSPESPHQKMALIDVDTYDRLKVALNEVRRVWRKGHPITLTFPDGTIWGVDDIGVLLTTTHSSL